MLKSLYFLSYINKQHIFKASSKTQPFSVLIQAPEANYQIDKTRTLPMNSNVFLTQI